MTFVIQPAVFAGEFNHKKRLTINVMHALVAQWASSSAPYLYTKRDAWGQLNVASQCFISPSASQKERVEERHSVRHK